MIRRPYLSEQDKELLLWVGLCITEWATIEHLLFRLTIVVLGVTPNHAATIYRKTPTLDSRITLIDELVSRVLLDSNPEKSGRHKSGLSLTWHVLVRDMTGLKSFRNKLAHWTRFTIARDEIEISPTRSVLHLSESDLWRGKYKESDKPIDVSDMSLHYELIEQLSTNIRRFIPEFSHRKTRHLRSVQREAEQRLVKERHKAMDRATGILPPYRPSRA
jgi:hypothetical protein